MLNRVDEASKSAKLATTASMGLRLGLTSRADSIQLFVSRFFVRVIRHSSLKSLPACILARSSAASSVLSQAYHTTVRRSGHFLDRSTDSVTKPRFDTFSPSIARGLAFERVVDLGAGSVRRARPQRDARRRRCRALRRIGASRSRSRFRGLVSGRPCGGCRLGTRRTPPTTRRSHCGTRGPAHSGNGFPPIARRTCVCGSSGWGRGASELL